MANADPVKAAIAGVAAGLVASLVMNGFQAALGALSSDNGDSGEPATEQAADRVAVAATGRPVPKDGKGAAGDLVHYAFGGALGLGYALVAEYRPGIAAGFGTAFGTGVWALADEAAVPALRLSPPPTRVAAGEHLYALVSHWVFGATVEGGRRLVRGAL